MARRFPTSGLVRFARIACAALLVFASSYCAPKGKETQNVELTPDEEYLAQTIARLDLARNLHASNYEKSESLFAVLDSTIDTTRVAKTIRALRSDPRRWALVFQRIERAEGSAAEGDALSEEGGR